MYEAGCRSWDNTYHGSSKTGRHDMAAIATHTYPKYCGCGIVGKKPKTMQIKKLNMMDLSILFKTFFPVKVTVRKTSVGALLSHSPHNTAGVPTLNGNKKDNKGIGLSCNPSLNSYPRTSTHIPFHLNITNASEHNNPFNTTSKATKLGTRAFPGIICKIRTDSIRKVKKKPLTEAETAK